MFYKAVILWGVLLLFLLAGACTPAGVEPGNEGYSGYPGPTTISATAVTLLPEPTVIMLDRDETYFGSTMTPWPTFTPRPIPTRLSGPTATPFLLQLPASDAGGKIFYLAKGNLIMEMLVDEQGLPIFTYLLPVSMYSMPILGPVSPDGRYLVLLETSFPGGIPYVYDSQTRQTWPLLRDHPQQEHISGWVYGWHPDSRQVLFWSMNTDALLFVGAETGKYEVVALTESPLQGVAISPDGQKVVYLGRIENDERIWIVSMAGDSVQPLLDSEGVAYVFGWSPTNKYVLYVYGLGYKENIETNNSTPGGPLWIMDPEGGERKQLSGPYLFGWGFQPLWSPDGQWVAFTGLDHGRNFGCAEKTHPDSAMCRYEGTAVYIENINTGEVRRLAPGIDPVWSPDGSHLVFISIQSGVPEVWQVQIDGSNLRQLTSDDQPKLQVVWSPAKR
jgi:hypothetical protein